ncbi:MAG TPA: hypothetical protein VF897_07255 [Roseiflexaceae bacterium]
MELYFSGIGGTQEAAFLRAAGVRHVLADVVDWHRITAWSGKRILDSGAYRAFKDSIILPSIPAYIAMAHQSEADWFLQQDVVGDQETTYANWLQMRHELRCLPVWQWGADRSYLVQLPDEVRDRPIAVGGLARHMHAHDEAMLAELVGLCSAYPDRFHILGAGWIKAIEALRWLALSCDTSKFMTGGRNGMVVFVNESARLVEAPFRALPWAADWDRARRCVESARALDQFCNGLPK